MELRSQSPASSRRLNKALVEDGKGEEINLSLRREEWTALKEIGKEWFGKDATYRQTIPRLLEELRYAFTSPPKCGMIKHKVEVRVEDVILLETLAEAFGADPSDVVRALVYMTDKAPEVLFVKPEDIPAGMSCPDKEYGESVVGTTMTEAEWADVCKKARMKQYLRDRGVVDG